MEDFFSETITEGIAELAAISGSPIYICRESDLILCESHIANVFDTDSEFLFEILKHSDGEISFYHEKNAIYYGLLNLDTDMTCIVGPFSVNKVDHSFDVEYMKRHDINRMSLFHIHSFSYHQAVSLLKRVYFVFTGKLYAKPVALPFGVPNQVSNSAKSRKITVEPITSQEAIFVEQQHYQLFNSEEDYLHHPYYQERMFSDFIKNADMDGVMKFFSDTDATRYGTGRMSNTQKKQEEYTTVLAVSLFKNAAIEAGCSPYDAYELGDLYIQKVSSSDSVEAYRQIFMESMMAYIKLVKNTNALHQQSPYTFRCKQYIARHLNQSITLDELADECHLNRTYLSNHFHEMEGITIQDYIQKERVKAAENMLKFSDYSISEIANYLQFHNQSYFGEVFKKHTEMSPGAYRKKYKPQGF